MRVDVKSLLQCAILLLLFSSFVDAEAHPHQGKVAPFVAGDPKVKLDRKAIAILESGRPYSTQIQSGSSGRGLVVQHVKAPTHIVWDRILDYNNYAKMVPKTLESQNYKVEKHRDGSQTIYTKMKVGFGMIRLTFYVKHEYLPKQNSLTWTLDYTKKSDFDDSCGYWYVVPHPDDPTHTRVYYSVQVSMFDWVPQFVVNFMSSKALTDATGWVKKFSEKEYSEMEPAALPEKEKKLGWFSKEKPEPEQEEECEEKEVAARQSPTVVGLTRYALVTSVFCLSVWNVHLYFSQ
jgi:ribosome-associated toxin RatA of RatAB toxin-antitoxin module